MDAQIANLVSRADVVFCPVDVNSHRACLSIKKVCKAQYKSYYRFAGSSLCSILQALAWIDS